MPHSIPIAGIEGPALKAAGLSKLDHARALIDAACQDLANLEGHGYCAKYEEFGKLRERLASMTAELRRLSPPTGVFKI